jgi:uncharacterized protein YgiM (DUF1202 family)
VKRWKSPQVAAKRAERAAKEAEKKRKEKRNTRLMIIGWAVVTIGLIVGDYFWLKARAQRRKAEHQQRFHQKTNALPLAVTNSGASPATNSAEKD